MTAEECIDGFRQLMGRFPGRKYRGADLNEVWSELLACSVVSFNRAVGLLITRSGTLPAAKTVLEITRSLEAGKDVFTEARPKVDGYDPGREAIRLQIARLQGTISDREYVEALYQISENSGLAEYATAAKTYEMRMEETAK